MKYRLWIPGPCPAAGALPCPTGQGRGEAAWVRMEKAWAGALDEHDTNALNCILADGFEDADIQGELSNRSTTQAKLATSPAVHYQLSDLDARLHGDLQYICGGPIE